MKRIVVQITIVLLLIAALPIGYIFIRQASELSENEAMVQQVYEQQLETILFTINQNSENIIYSWINRIDIPVQQADEVMEQVVNRLLQYNSAIEKIAFFDIETGTVITHYGQNAEERIASPDVVLRRKLVSFMEQNYQRIEGVNDGRFTTLYFMTRSGDNNCIGAFKVNTNTFIDQNLGPGIQQISQDRFHISLTDTSAISQSLNEEHNPERLSGIHYSAMWYLPGYRAQIELQTATIQELVKNRSQYDKYIFSGLILLVILGLVFTIYTVRREMRLAELKSEFVSNVSHEIRTPLALISMYAETLLMKRVKNTQKTDEYLGVIVNETNRLTAIVNRILNFSKMERNKREYRFASVNVNSLIKKILQNFEPQFAANNIQNTLDLKGELIISADEEAIEEAIINLIDNAVKYGKNNNPAIKIKTGIKNSEIFIDIEDNGIGISPKHQKLIFDKFYRVTQGNLAHQAKGSGLGLNIVQQILKQHNARIEVKSQPGKGSTFSLIFKPKA